MSGIDTDPLANFRSAQDSTAQPWLNTIGEVGEF
jgi:hypothetical protein